MARLTGGRERWLGVGWWVGQTRVSCVCVCGGGVVPVVGRGGAGRARVTRVVREGWVGGVCRLFRV